MLLLLALTVLVEFVTPSCLSTSITEVCLETEQVMKINDNNNEPIKTDIRDNYFKNTTYYSRLDPLVNLTAAQEEAILERFAPFFRRHAPSVPGTFMWDGKMYTDDAGRRRRRRRRRQSPSNYVCPSDGVYSDINFCISNSSQVLQMVQMADDRQWVMTETCLNPAGNGVPNTICVDRIREIPAVVINVDYPESIAVELIQVSCCAAHDVL